MAEQDLVRHESNDSNSGFKPSTVCTITQDASNMEVRNGTSTHTTYSSFPQTSQRKTAHNSVTKKTNKGLLSCFGNSKKEENDLSGDDRDGENVNMAVDRLTLPNRLIYGLTDTPPVYFLIFFALQQAFLAISTPLGTAVVVAEAVCAQEEESLKVQILSSTMLMMGLSTFFMTTLGCRLPIFQGPAPTYIIPLIAMSNLPEFSCPETFRAINPEDNTTQLMALVGNGTVTPNKDIALSRINAYAGALMAAGAIHFVVGVTGLSGLLGRVIGPITVVPTVALFGIFIHPVVVSFVETNWSVAIITSGVCIVCSLYLGNKSTPIPMWSKKKGFHVIWYPIHQVFAILIGICIGWLVSWIMTEAGALSDDPENVEFNARTDARSYVIGETAWITLPYPGQFGEISFSFGAFVTFLISAILSIIDSIADYNATAKAAHAPPPPTYAINRGISIEGLMTILSGSLGCGHATVSYGENIGAISMSKVASRSVFQMVGLFYILLAIVGKFGAFFITLPYSVIGGSQIITFGLLIGVVVSYLQFIDLNSTRNLSIIGMSILLGMSIPYWMAKNAGKVNTGNYDADNAFKILLSNPSFVGAFLACFLDNTIPGTERERGITPQPIKTDEVGGELYNLASQSDREKPKYFDDGLEVYRLPLLPDSFRKSRFAKVVPLFDTTIS